MPIFHLIVLAAVQGITEFLPISSSGHLVLVPILTGWRDQGLLLDVAVHVGTLVAVILYFWRDLWTLTQAVFRSLRRSTSRGMDHNVWLAVNLVVATLPVVVAGFLFNHFLKNGIRSLEVVAWATVGFAIVLYYADRRSMTVRQLEHVRLGGALFIGLMQVLALIPGTSRSGITVTAARFLGIERTDAARFSMLLSIPTILGAGVLKGIDLYRAGNPLLTRDAAVVAGLSMVFALITIALLMAWLRRASFTIFVVYRILLGGGLLYLAYFTASPVVF